jgi:hypothetical protein
MITHFMACYLLVSCNHAGLIEDGYRLFRLVKEEQLEILKNRALF